MGSDELVAILVDDEDSRADARRLMLEMDGYRVAQARGLAGAVEAAARLHPDLIFIDLYRRPAAEVDLVDGLHRELATAGTPIVLITGPDDPPAARHLAFADQLVHAWTGPRPFGLDEDSWSPGPADRADPLASEGLGPSALVGPVRLLEAAGRR